MNGKVILGTLLGLGAGVAVGLLLGKEFYEQQYLLLAEKEIAEAKEYYSKINKTGDYATPEAAKNKLSSSPKARAKKIIKQSRYGSPVEPDYSDEDAKRSMDEPYVLSVEEFMSGHENYTQVTLTYYIMDQVLADTDDTDMSHEIEKMVGRDNLNKFGHRSGDDKVVYVRNEIHHIDFEIILNGQSYAEVVHGITANSKE